MKANAQITIKGLQLNSKNSDMMELVTEGSYYSKNGSFYIIYKESDVTGMDGTTTTIKAKDSVVTLTRHGTVNNQFVFSKSEKQQSYYETPYGSFVMNVFSKKVDIDLSEKGGGLNIIYSLDINGQLSSDNNINLSVRTIATQN